MKTTRKHVFGIAMSVGMILPTLASAHMDHHDVKTMECSGVKYQLWIVHDGDSGILEYSPRAATKVHSENLKSMMLKGQTLHNAKLSCSSGALKLDFAAYGSTKNQSLLLTKSGRVLDVTPKPAEPIQPPYRWPYNYPFHIR